MRHLDKRIDAWLHDFVDGDVGRLIDYLHKGTEALQVDMRIFHARQHQREQPRSPEYPLAAMQPAQGNRDSVDAPEE